MHIARDRWDETGDQLSFIYSLCLSVSLLFIKKSKKWGKKEKEKWSKGDHVRVSCIYLGLPETRGGSCTVSPPSSKGGMWDLISPGNIKEAPCFIQQHKAPEFTQIKFSRLCLRDQARGSDTYRNDWTVEGGEGCLTFWGDSQRCEMVHRSPAPTNPSEFFAARSLLGWPWRLICLLPLSLLPNLISCRQKV